MNTELHEGHGAVAGQVDCRVRPRAWLVTNPDDPSDKGAVWNNEPTPDDIAFFTRHSDRAFEVLPLYEAPRWVPIAAVPMPRDGGSYLVADAVRGLVAPHIRGVIHNNPGTTWDWQYGEAITHWMPLPEPPPLVSTGPNASLSGGRRPSA